VHVHVLLLPQKKMTPGWRWQKQQQHRRAAAAEAAVE